MIAFCTPVAAETVTSELLRDYDRNQNRLLTEQALIATENGFGWANADLKRRNLPPLYCIGPYLVPTGAQLGDILRRSMKREPWLADAPYGMALLMAMQVTFPCDKSDAACPSP